VGRKQINEEPMTPLERQRRHRAKRKQERAANVHRPRAYRIEQKLRTVLGQLGQLDTLAAMLRAEGKAKADRAAIDLLNEDAVPAIAAG
jgi:hypothetical protein